MEPIEIDEEEEYYFDDDDDDEELPEEDLAKLIYQIFIGTQNDVQAMVH